MYTRSRKSLVQEILVSGLGKIINLTEENQRPDRSRADKQAQEINKSNSGMMNKTMDRKMEWRSVSLKMQMSDRVDVT
jgi:hypothetical protein